MKIIARDARDLNQSTNRNKVGGLSGKPIFNNSTKLLKKIFNYTEGRIPLVGVGGVSNGKECYEKIKSGASLVQLYTSLVYNGPNSIKNIKKDLINCLINDGHKNIKDAVGIETWINQLILKEFQQ